MHDEVFPKGCGQGHMTLKFSEICDNIFQMVHGRHMPRVKHE